MPGHREDVEVGSMAMALFVSSNWHFRHMGVHCSLCQGEHYVRTSRTTVLPFFQFEGAEVRYEVGFPHVSSWTVGDELTFALEVTTITHSSSKVVGIVEDEIVIVKQLHDHREIGG